MNQLLKEFSPEEWKVIAALAGVLVALVVALLSPILQWWVIARRQTKLQEQIATRQAELQEQIAKRQGELQAQIAKRQAADNISSKRQIWIDELRRDFAEYLSEVSHMEDLRFPDKSLSEDVKKKMADEQALANRRATELSLRIKLRLNPNEAEHNDLVKQLAKLAYIANARSESESIEQRNTALSANAQVRAAVVGRVQQILKGEWERIKRGD